MNKPIDTEGFYTGPELKWSVEDVECIAQRLDYDLDQATLERVLIATLEDNETLMLQIIKHIEDTFDYMDKTDALRTMNK